MPIPFQPRRRIAIAVLLSLTWPHAHAADAGLRAAVDRAVAPLMAQHGAPGVAVAVTVDGQSMFFNYGVASKQGGTPVDEHTLFEIGSVSKPFTATLALYAQASGKLSLADHPGKYLAQLKGAPIDAATLLHLGTYTGGGLPQQVPEEVENDAQLLPYLRNWKPLAAPGTQRRYSNPSIGLLGRIAALALGADFGAAVEGTLFPALGMRESHVRVPPAAMGRYAWGHDSTGQPARVRPDVLDEEAYGVKASAADMIRFVQVNIDPARVAGPMRRAVEGTQAGYFQVGDMVQGLGWEQYRGAVTLERLLAGNAEKISREANPVTPVAPAAPAGTWFNKTGATRGFSSYVAFVPSQRIGVVLLANRFCPAPARIAAVHAVMRQLGAPGN